MSKYLKQYYQKNKEKLAAANKKWAQDNSDKMRTYRKRWEIANPDKVIANNNRISKKVYIREYAKKNRKRITAQQTARIQADPQLKLKKALRARFLRALKGAYKGGSAVKDLGCSIADFKIRLETQFQPGMTWENYGKWHIDHIVPLSNFDLSNPDHVMLACHYSNLQPLWAADNIRKRNKILAIE